SIGDGARFLRVLGTAWDPAGFLYLADTDAKRIRRLDLSTLEVSTLATGFGFPYGLAYRASSHTLYVADQTALRAVDVGTGQVTTVAGGTSGSSDGVGTAARFGALAGLCFDGGLLYLADSGSDTIRTFDPMTAQVTTVAGT